MSPASAASFSEILGRTIRLRREVRGASLKEMAEHQGMTNSGWSRVETGDVEIKASQLVRAASFLHVSAWQLVKDAEDLAGTIGAGGTEIETKDGRKDG